MTLWRFRWSGGDPHQVARAGFDPRNRHSLGGVVAKHTRLTSGRHGSESRPRDRSS